MEKWEFHNTALLKISAHLYGACDHMLLLKWQNNVMQDHCQLQWIQQKLEKVKDYHLDA